MSNAEENTIVTRYLYRYHNDSLSSLNILLLGLLTLIAVLCFFVFVQIMSKPTPLYFRLNENMQIINPVPLDQEGISRAALLNWVNEIVMKAYNFNYSNMKNQTSKLAPYFTDAAMKVYQDLLLNDEDFRTIPDNRYVVSVTPKAAPEIVVGKPFQGRYAWQIKVPVKITLSNALIRATQDATLNYLIWRVPETESPLGITVVTFTQKVNYRSAPEGIRK